MRHLANTTYTLHELHAYAAACGYPDDATKLRHYIDLRQAETGRSVKRIAFDVPISWLREWPHGMLAGTTGAVEEEVDGSQLLDLIVMEDGERVDTTDLELAELAAVTERFGKEGVQ